MSPPARPRPPAGPPARRLFPGVPLPWLAVAALAGIALLLLLAFAAAPVLYTAKTAAVTASHEDVAVTGGLTRTEGAEVLPAWSTSLNETGRVTATVLDGDAEAVGDALEACGESALSLDTLVVGLDIADTDVGAFNELNWANVASLEEFANQTAEFRRLGVLPAGPADGPVTSALAAEPTLEPDVWELLTRLRANYYAYAGRAPEVRNLSQKYGLDTSEYEQSLRDYESVLLQVEAALGTPAGSLPESSWGENGSALCPPASPDGVARSGSGERCIVRPPIPTPDPRGGGGGGVDGGEGAISSPVGFAVVPDRGAYGDTLSMEGSVAGSPGIGVSIYSGGELLGGVVTSGHGWYAFPYRIEWIDAGEHQAYASAGGSTSRAVNFTVLERNTTVSLGVRMVMEDGVSIGVCTGKLLTTDAVPVRYALVDIYLDDGAWDQAMTAVDGTYALNVTGLPAGTHTLSARYRPDGLPLAGSTSAPVAIDVPSILDWQPSFYAVGTAAAGLGAVLYLRRWHALMLLPVAAAVRRAPAGPAPPPPEPPVVLPLTPTAGEAAAAAALLIAGVDGREAITRLYRRLVRELDARNSGQHLLSFTPREIAARFARGPWGAELTALVAVHERVCYAGTVPIEEDIRKVREVFISVVSGGEGH